MTTRRNIHYKIGDKNVSDLEKRLQEADRHDSWLLSQQMMLLDVEEKGIKVDLHKAIGPVIKNKMIFDWGKVIWSKLDESIRIPWEVLFPGTIEGMTWEGSCAYQGVGTGRKAQRFPSSLPLRSRRAKIMFKHRKRDNVWFARIEGGEKRIIAFLLLLKGADVIGRIDICNFEVRPIPFDLIDKSDRFIIQYPTSR